MRIKINWRPLASRCQAFCFIGLTVSILTTTSQTMQAASSNDKTVETQITSGGLEYRQLARGAGEPAQLGDIVHIHLSGWIETDNQQGREFFNSKKRGSAPQVFVLGSDRIMPAWNEGVLGMRAGGSRMLRVPPSLGFGNQGLAKRGISANDFLLLKLTLVEINKQP